MQKEIEKLKADASKDPKNTSVPAFADEKKKVVGTLGRELTTRAEGYGKKNDHEAAMVLYALAEAVGVDGANAKVNDHSEKLRILKNIDRAATDDLAAAARSWRDPLYDLQVSANKKKLAAEAAWCEVVAQQLGHAADALAALRAINDRRLAAGLKLVGLRQDASYACMLHARYVSLTKKFDPMEDPASPHATIEGTKAAQNSLIAPGALPAAVGTWMRTVRGRAGLMAAGLKNVGFGQWLGNQADACAIDTVTGRTPSNEVVLWPPMASTGIDLEYATETPSPLPGGVTTTCGNPITVTYADDRAVAGATCKLEEAAGGGAIECFVSDPGKPGLAGFPDNLRTIAAIPKTPLKAKTKYRATIAATVDGKPTSLTIEFETK